MPTQMPMLDDLFFNVCSTAIKNTSWKYADFEKVKNVEGKLDQLHAFLINLYNTEVEEAEDKAMLTPEAPEASEEVKAPEASEEVSEDQVPGVIEDVPEEITPEAPDVPNVKKKILTPDEVKKVPERLMPDDIREIVEAGIEVSKNPPRVREVQVIDLPSDPDQARQAWSKPF